MRATDRTGRLATRATAGRVIAAQIDGVENQLLEQLGKNLGAVAGDIERMTGGGWAHFDATLSTALAGVSQEAGFRTIEALRKHWLPMVRAAVDAWPVDTGRSKDGLRLLFDASSGALRSRFVSEADYTKYIRFGRQTSANGGKMVWQTMVAGPARAVARRMVDSISGRRAT